MECQGNVLARATLMGLRESGSRPLTRNLSGPVDLRLGSQRWAEGLCVLVSVHVLRERER